jgi:predicted ArsR family transcriptional regulator
MAGHRDLLILRSAAQIRAVTPPLRAEILDHLLRSDGRSIAELAVLMGRRPNAIAYHVRCLATAGILLVVGHRRTRGRSEAIYRLRKARIGIATSAGSPAHARLVVRGAAAALRLAEREIADAITTGSLRDDAGEVRPGARHRARLSEADVAAVQRRLAEVARIFDRRREATSGRMFALTYVLVPVRDRRLGTANA